MERIRCTCNVGDKDINFLNLRFLWPCIMNVGWRERDQQDATNLKFIIKLLSQHVSVIIMPIIRRTRVCTAAYVVLSRTVTFTVHTARVQAPHNHSHHNRCRTPYAEVHTLVLLKMGIMMTETCWDRDLIINIKLVASCWFPFLHHLIIMLQINIPSQYVHTYICYIQFRYGSYSISFENFSI